MNTEGHLRLVGPSPAPAASSTGATLSSRQRRVRVARELTARLVILERKIEGLSTAFAQDQAGVGHSITALQPQATRLLAARLRHLAMQPQPPSTANDTRVGQALQTFRRGLAEAIARQRRQRTALLHLQARHALLQRLHMRLAQALGQDGPGPAQLPAGVRRQLQLCHTQLEGLRAQHVRHQRALQRLLKDFGLLVPARARPAPSSRLGRPAWRWIAGLAGSLLLAVGLVLLLGVRPTAPVAETQQLGQLAANVAAHDRTQAAMQTRQDEQAAALAALLARVDAHQLELQRLQDVSQQSRAILQRADADITALQLALRRLRQPGSNLAVPASATTEESSTITMPVALPGLRPSL